ARIDADHADVLDPALRAVARAAGDGELHLVRCVHLPERALQRLAQRGRVLRAEAAPLRTDAGLHGAQGLGVGMPARHVEVLPDVGKVFPAHAEQVDALAARDLDGRYPVLLDHVGNAAQLARARLAAPDAGHHGVGAVLLDVGVVALVDEAGTRIVLRLARPGAGQVVVERRPAL